MRIQDIFALQHRGRNDSPPASNFQLRALNIAMIEAVGQLKRDERLRLLSLIYGWRIESTKDLSRAEVTAFLNMLNNPRWAEPFKEWLRELQYEPA